MVSVHLGQLAEDEKQARVIERRRQFEAARKERIFSPCRLRMGLDLEALDAQVKERRQRELAQRERDQAYDKQCLYFGAVLELQKAELQHDRKQRQQEIAAYNLAASRKKELQKEFAAEAEKQFNAEESRASAGPSCMLVLEGEDITFSLRKKRQQAQQKEANQEQLFQQSLQQLQERDRNMEYEEFATRNRRLAEAIYQQQMKEQAQQRLDTSNTNLELADERRKREATTREMEKEAENREVEIKLHDRFLAEGRQDLVSGNASLSPSLPRLPTGSLARNRDGFKGFPLEVKEAAASENVELTKKAKEREAEQKRILREWESFAETQRRVGVVLEREKERQRRQTALGVAQTNKILEDEQKERELKRNKQLYRGAIGVEYNNYFSTTSR